MGTNIQRFSKIKYLQLSLIIITRKKSETGMKEAASSYLRSKELVE